MHTVPQIRVRAASVNPLDVEMTSGYGSGVLNAVRSARAVAGVGDALVTREDDDDGEFPLTPGRDFSGEVVSCGCQAASNFSPGQKVNGVVLPSQRSGAHQAYVVTNQSLVRARFTTRNSISNLDDLTHSFMWMADLCCFSGVFKALLLEPRGGGLGAVRWHDRVLCSLALRRTWSRREQEQEGQGSGVGRDGRGGTLGSAAGQALLLRRRGRGRVLSQGRTDGRRIGSASNHQLSGGKFQRKIKSRERVSHFPESYRIYFLQMNFSLLNKV